MKRLHPRFALPAAATGSVLLGFFLAAGLPLVARTVGQDVQDVQKVPEAVLYRPTAVPDRVILTFDGDPARTQAVTWRTDASVGSGQAVAQVALASASPNFGEKSVSVTAATTPLTTNLGVAHCHSARMTNLSPGTLYAYRVGDGTNWSEWFHFRTASARPEPFSFIYFGDAQNDLKSLWSRAVRAAHGEAPKARFFIHAGDLINRAGNDAEWGEWFGAGGWLNGMTPSLSTPGNHEYAGTPKALDNHWRAQFALPQNGPAGLEETCYFVDYQGARIVSLNTEERHAEQAAWLDGVLANNPNRWTVLTFHRPMYSSATGRDNAALRELWLPVFDKHRVDLVLQGHDHTYARSQNLRAGVNVRDAGSGTVYVVSVSGPKMYNLDRAPWMRRAAEDTQLYQIITVDGGQLRYEARTVTGERYDAFTLVKQAKGVNLLVEQAPRTPERLRARQSGNSEVAGPPSPLVR